MCNCAVTANAISAVIAPGSDVAQSLLWSPNLMCMRPCPRGTRVQTALLGPLGRLKAVLASPILWCGCGHGLVFVTLLRTIVILSGCGCVCWFIVSVDVV